MKISCINITKYCYIGSAINKCFDVDNPFFGKTQSNETKQKMKEAWKNRKNQI